MKPTPAGWPQISTAVYYRDPLAAIERLCQGFGFEVRIKVIGARGELVHSELTYGQGVVMVGAERGEASAPGAHQRRSPLSVQNNNTQNMFTYVDDVDAHCARARTAGFTVVAEPKVTDYGPEHWVDKGYEVIDHEGHHWWFAERVRTSSGT